MPPWIGRVIILVLDGAGVGALPDAACYGDADANTLGHVAARATLKLPCLQALGLGNILPLPGVPPEERPAAAFGRMAEQSAGKDTTLGHWELMGVVSPQPFPTYPNGFPDAIIEEFAARTGRGVLGNKAASGTQIIEELADEQRRSGKWIVYTSADSVFQVAAHEEVIPVAELYRACETAAQMLMPSRKILRVIARPFVGQRGSLRRTAGRRDYNMPPPAQTVLDLLSEAHWPVVTIGKVHNVFAGRGVTEALVAADNAQALDALADELQLPRFGLVLANLVDFDTVYGHRNDVGGYAAALAEFDRRLARLLPLLRARDVLVITADHGCDPTTPGTDHTREYVPLLVYGKCVAAGVNLGARRSFADLGATVCQALGTRLPPAGHGFWTQIAVPGQGCVERAERARLDWACRRGLYGWRPG